MRTLFVCFSFVCFASSLSHAGEAAVAPASAAAPKASASAPARGPASDDPNRAVEVRGQSRTLSMMLVLKNGKENIDFIKPRKDFAPEIANTAY